MFAVHKTSLLKKCPGMDSIGLGYGQTFGLPPGHNCNCDCQADTIHFSHHTALKNQVKPFFVDIIGRRVIGLENGCVGLIVACDLVWV
jgi:hypothetical protein